MHKVVTYPLNGTRKAYEIFFKLPETSTPMRLDYEGQAASNFIKDLILNDQPCMISRFGANELQATIRYLDITENKSFIIKSLKYIRGEAGKFWWDDSVKFSMEKHGGFFPANEEFLARFGNRMLTDIKNIDVLGSWLAGEARLSQFFPKAKTIPLGDLDPYCHSHPWSKALEDKIILIIHPFEKSIQRQYAKRDVLFDNPEVLPRFQLKTLKAVQSISGNSVPFSNWFQALDSMCFQISNINFDIAIIGAGAYGLPLAAYIKSIGKKAIHLGGATQILFGIKGKRWDERPFYRQLYNENWVRPLSIEVPDKAHIVEGGCYW